MNMDTQTTDLLLILNRLIDVLRQELDLLHEMKPRDMQMLQEDKIVLVAAYESHVSQLRKNPDALKNLNPDLRNQLIRTTEVFQKTLAENAQALLAVREANDRLIKAIARGIEEQRTPVSGYSATGSQPRLGVPDRYEPVSVSVDQRL